jgi:hypothetical protein
MADGPGIESSWLTQAGTGANKGFLRGVQDRLSTPQNFADWAALAAAPAGVRLDWPKAAFSTCVVTAATGYPAEVLKPLVLSLRAHSDAPLVVITDRGEELKSAYPDAGLVIYPVPGQSGYRPYPALARLEFYLQLLTSLPDGVERLLFVDSRDVIFQAEPFKGLKDVPLEFFAENDDQNSWTLFTTNGRWARMMLPRAMSRALEGCAIANGGVIAGTPEGLAAMCRAKLDIALATHEWTKHTTGLDNISTNVVAHSGVVEGSTVTANHGQVANIYRDTPMRIDQQGCIASPGGAVCPIVHMYDRQPALLAHVNAAYAVDDSGLALGQDRSLSKPSPFAGVRHWLKLARIRLLGS